MWLGDGSLSGGGCAAAEIFHRFFYLGKAAFRLAREDRLHAYNQEDSESREEGATVSLEYHACARLCITVAISGKQLHRFCTEVLLREWPGSRGNREFNRGYLDSDYYYMPIRKLETEEYSGHRLQSRGRESTVAM